MAQEEVQNNGSEKNGSTNTTTVTFSSFKPQLLVEAPKANDAVQFYKTAFGAEEVSRALHPKRKADQEIPLVLCADLKIGGSVFSVSDRTDDSTPVKNEGGGLVFNLETEDIEGAITKAVSAGAVSEGQVIEDEIAGRVGKVKDPFGFVWVISSPVVKNAVDVEA